MDERLRRGPDRPALVVDEHDVLLVDCIAILRCPPCPLPMPGGVP
jgi:hypothetical protein